MNDEGLSREIERLYRRAFAEYGVVTLWSSRQAKSPTAADVLAITRSLPVEGDLGARRLAERIEELCARASVRNQPLRLTRGGA
jgi:hypothetical protein